MGPIEMPMPLQKSTPEQVGYTNLTWAGLIDILTGGKEANGKIETTMSNQENDKKQESAQKQITELGQIGKIDLPQGWLEGKSESGGIGTSSWREVHPGTAPDATLCFYYRGKPVSDEAGKNFSAILEKPPHALSQSEINSIGEVLRGKDDPATFKPLMIRTEDLNGRRVLSFSGGLRQTGEDLQGIIIDADGTGKVPQEVYFQAPQDLYLRYNKAAKEAIKSIAWR